MEVTNRGCGKRPAHPHQEPAPGSARCKAAQEPAVHVVEKNLFRYTDRAHSTADRGCCCTGRRTKEVLPGGGGRGSFGPLGALGHCYCGGLRGWAL